MVKKGNPSTFFNQIINWVSLSFYNPDIVASYNEKFNYLITKKEFLKNSKDECRLLKNTFQSLDVKTVSNSSCITAPFLSHNLNNNIND